MIRPSKLALALAPILLAAGCSGPPQVGADNRRLVESLLTAVSMQRVDLVEEHARIVAARKAEGKLSDAEERAFRSILEPARAGDWKAAVDRAFDLRDAQRPNRADVVKLPEHARS